MGFLDYLPGILRRKWVVIITFIATIVVVGLGYLLIPTTYTAETIIRVIPYSAGEPPYAQIVYAERIMNTYVEIAESSPILDEMRNRVGIGENQPKSIQVGIIPDSELIRISVDDTDPEIAQNVANTLAMILLEQRSIRDVRTSIVQPGILITTPSLLKNLVYGFVVVVLGAVGGVGLAIFIDSMDTKLYSAEDIEKFSQLPVLAKIPAMNNTLPTWQQTPPWLDSIFRLRKNLFSAIDLDEPKTILVISPIPDEGKSTITANLAQSAAQAGINTLIVDSNYHNPELHKLLEVSNEDGFLDALETNRLKSESLLETKYKNLKVFPSGKKPAEAVNLVSSNNVVSLFEKLKSKADLVLIDSPAFLVASETEIYAQLADSIIMVVGAGTCDQQALVDTLEQLKQKDITPLGVVVNRSEETPTFKYWKDYYP